MKRFLALLLLAGCGSQDGSQRGASGGAGLPGEAGMSEMEGNDENPAQLQARAVAALSSELPDPQSARYANVRKGAGEAICGDVDAKGVDGEYSGYRPFVVSPEGVAVVSRTRTVMFNDPGDLFPDAYIRWCAPPEELNSLGARVAGGDPALTKPIGEEVLNIAPTPEDTLLAEQPAPAVPVVPPPPRPEPPAEVVPPASKENGVQEDSFFKAVKRKSEP
jgi:hypothetical protein